MYILKPYLSFFGLFLVVCSYFMVAKPQAALEWYLSHITPTSDSASVWLKSFRAESSRSLMWQSPMHPLMIHLIQVSGCVTFGLGALLTMSITFGSSKRFTEGCCLLVSMVMYELLSGSTRLSFVKYATMALLALALIVNRAVAYQAKQKRT